MRSFTSLLAVAGTASAQAIMGFNSGSTMADGTVKVQSDFEAEFTAAAGLEGAPGSFSSVRLYTMVQGGTTSDPLSAFPAAIKTNTTMLLGIWCSGTTTIQNDLDALSKAIDQYGNDFANLVVGISVGSEDLYRNSATGVANKAGVGADPDVVLGFITQVRDTIKGTALEKTPVGHVDTWDTWGNSSNKAVVDAIDFLGTDAYPYFESNKGNNSIENALTLWTEAIDAANAAANGKPVWITETGWPSTGPAWGIAEATVDNAKTYWDEVGCTLFGKTNTWWYTLRDSNPADEAQFAITSDLSTTPKFNLTCPAVKASASASASGSSASATGTVTDGTSPVTGGESGSSSGSSSSSGASSSGASSSSTGTSGAPAVAPRSFVAAVILAVAAIFVL
jgi:glucan endo-1,3-beta-D-glucosidase